MKAHKETQKNAFYLCSCVFLRGFTAGVLVFRRWLLAQISSCRYWCATRNVGDLSFLGILVRSIIYRIGVRIIMATVVGSAVLGDQARALDPPVIFFIERIRDCFPDPHNR